MSRCLYLAVASTGNDPWGDLGAFPISTQFVNSQIAKANTYVPGGGPCTSTGGTFYIQTGPGGNRASLNETSLDIWYDVETVPDAYPNHTDGDPSRWDSSAVRTVGSVKVGVRGGPSWSLITAATDGPQGTGQAVNVSDNVAGPFYVAPNETSANSSPSESGVGLVDVTCTNGNTAPLTLL